MILGWRVIPEPVDGGIPPTVSRIFADALCSLYRVIGMSTREDKVSSRHWIQCGNEFDQQLRKHKYRILDILFRFPSNAVLICSQSPNTVVRFLDDDVFHWSQEGQFLLLCEPTSSAPPEVPRTRVKEIFTPSWWKCVAEIHAFEGIWRARVNGDVAGIYMKTPEQAERLIHALEETSERHGFLWEISDAASFLDRLSPAGSQFYE